MEPPSYEKIMTSRVFQFIVGPRLKVFSVHKEIIAHHSRPLSVMVSGPMAESRTGKATLEDVDEESFARFCQYMYTGSYDVPKAELDTEMSYPYYYAPVWTCYQVNASSSSYRLTRSKREQAWIEFCSKSVYADARPSAATGAPDVATTASINNVAADIYAGVFLCHAKLYVFADRYDVPELRLLCLRKLHKTLVGYAIFANRCGDIVALLRYVYGNTTDRGPGAADADELRALVVSYTACVVEHLAACTEFGELLGSAAELGRDLVKELAKRLD